MTTCRKLTVLAAAAALGTVLAGCGDPAFTRQPNTVPPPAPGSLPGKQLERQAFGPKCAQLPNGAQFGSFDTLGSRPVAAAAATSVFTERFTDALRTAELTESLDGMPAATVLAPYDQAFDELKDELGGQRFDTLLGDRNGLATLLQYHVVPGERYDRAGLLAAGTVRPMAGGELRIVETRDALTVVDGAGATAHVLCGNIQTKNATLYLIDRVLRPTRETVPPS